MKSQLLYYVKSVQIQTRETSVFGYFSRTVSDAFFQIFHIIICVFFCFSTRFKFNSSRIFHFIHCYNPFLAKVPILYTLKRPKNKRFSRVFKQHKIAILARNGLRNRPRFRKFKTFFLVY